MLALFFNAKAVDKPILFTKMYKFHHVSLQLLSRSIELDYRLEYNCRSTIKLTKP